MPGYGFAKAPKKTVETWTKLIHAYLKGRPNLRRVFVLIDGRHGPKPADETVMNELDGAAVSYQIVITKADKPKAAELEKVIALTSKIISKHGAAHPEMLITSSEKKDGIDELRAVIAQLLVS
jgi:GTP-binding protein